MVTYSYTAAIGCGFCSAGVGSSAGYGTAASATARKRSNYLRDDGTQASTRMIDSLQKDYVLDSDGNFEGIDSQQQNVLLALTTGKDSTYIKNFGLDLSQFKTITSDLSLKIRDAVNIALSDLIRRKLINLIDVQVSRLPNNNDGIYVDVIWQDLSTAQINKTTLGK